MFRLMNLQTGQILKGELLEAYVVTHDDRVLEIVCDGEGSLSLEDRSEEFGILRVIPNG